MDAETTKIGLTIDGKIYDFPYLDDFTMNELAFLYEKTGLIQEDFIEREDETPEEKTKRERLLSLPQFWSVVFFVAYKRGNPDATEEEITEIVKKTVYIEAVSTLRAPSQEGDATVPLALTSSPESRSPESSLSRNDTTGDNGRRDSDPVDADLSLTGIGRSESAVTDPSPSTISGA